MSAAVVDLKAELRAESAKAATKAAPSTQPRARQQDSMSSEAPAAVKYVAPAPLYEPKESTGDASVSPSDALTAGVGHVAAAARGSLSLEKLDLSGISGQVQHITGQVEL